MAVGRYMVVSQDATDRTIYLGPILADPAVFTPPEGRMLITEAAATANAYTYPARPGVEVNAEILRSRAEQGLAANAAFLAVSAPTNAQTLAQVRNLTRECTGLIRLMLGALDSTDGS